MNSALERTTLPDVPLALRRATRPSAEGRAGAVAIAVAAILWSSGGVVIKLSSLSAWTMVFGRAFVAALFFLVVLRVSLRGARLSTAVAYAGTMITFILATKLTTAANAVFLQYSGSAYVLVLGPWLLRERLRRTDVACAMASLIGVSLVLLGGADAGRWSGNLVAAASGVFFASTIVLMRRDARAGSALPSTALGNVIAAAIAAPFATFDRATFTPTSLLVVGYLGAIGIGLAYLLFTHGLKTTSASKASVLAALEPVLNPLWVALAISERPSGWSLVGGALVVVAIATSATLSTAPAHSRSPHVPLLPPGEGARG